MVKSACCSLATKVGNEWEEGEGRELSQRRGGKRYSMSSAPFPNRDSGTASFRPHKQTWWSASGHRVRSAVAAAAMALGGKRIKVC